MGHDAIAPSNGPTSGHKGMAVLGGVIGLRYVSGNSKGTVAFAKDVTQYFVEALARV
jgi:hypothetical protein